MMNLAEYRRSMTHLADFLPWAALVDEGVVLNKDGSFQRSFRSYRRIPPIPKTDRLPDASSWAILKSTGSRQRRPELLVAAWSQKSSR